MVQLLFFVIFAGSHALLRKNIHSNTFCRSSPLTNFKRHIILHESNDQGNAFENNAPLKDLVEKVKGQTAGFVEKLSDEGTRTQTLSDLVEKLKTSFTYAGKNIGEGEVGKRGEGWFAAQMTLFAFVLFGVPSLLAVLLKLGGVFTIVTSLYFLLGGFFELGESTSPFPIPGSYNQLKTTGVYAIVRHPMYCGLLLLCLGLSTLSDSAARLIITLILALVLNQKASIEESAMLKAHPRGYAMYMVETRSKLLPLLY